MVLFCLSHTSHILPSHPKPPPRIYSPGWIFPKCDRERQFTLPNLCFARNPSLQGSCATFHQFARVLDSYPKYSIWVCNYTYWQQHTFLASLKLKARGANQMFLNLASLIQNSRWQDFTWKCTRLTQHLFLLTSHFYDQRFWSLPPLLSRKNSTFELTCMGRGALSFEKYFDLLQQACRGG